MSTSGVTCLRKRTHTYTFLRSLLFGFILMLRLSSHTRMRFPFLFACACS